MLQVELSGDCCRDCASTDGVVHAHGIVASGHKEVQTHHHHVDGDDDGGHGGGPEHGLGAKRLQDAEASLAGYDGRQDLGNPGEPVETQEAVIGHELQHWSVSKTKRR